MTKMDEVIVDPEWGILKSAKITKYNRSTSVMKLELTFLKDIPDNILVSTTYNLLFTRVLSFIPFNRL